MLKAIGAYTSILLAWVMFASCGVGHNQILFVTKTNASLEIDNPPPTAVFGIGRIEGEFSPQFEGGQKIPTLASFKFENQEMLAPHLGSAFAVGDAAMAMANLYNDPTPNGGYKDREKLLEAQSFNSTLELTQAPKSKIPNLDFPGPGEVSPVFFGTETSFGLTLGWSGLTAQYPDTARLGYVRKELALVPISYQEKENKHRVRAASLLATVDSNVKSQPMCGKEGAKTSQCVDLDYLQYFATGKAATLMAMRQEVRKAMIARLDPNREKVMTLGGKLPTDRKHVATRLLSIIADTLRALKPSDPIAAEHLKRLNAATKNFGIPKCYFTGKPGLKYIVYTGSASGNALKIWDDCSKEPKLFDPNRFGSALRYWRTLSDTVRYTSEAIKQVKTDRSSVTLIKNDGPITSPDWDNELTTLATQLERHRHRLHDLDAKIGGNREVIAAYQYVISMLQ